MAAPVFPALAMFRVSRWLRGCAGKPLILHPHGRFGPAYDGRAAYYADSKPTLQVVHVYLDVPQDFSQESRTDIPTLMNGHCGPTSVGMFKLPVAAARFSKQAKTKPLEDLN